MNRKLNLTAALPLLASLLLSAGVAQATSLNPLDDGGWELVAHIASSGGMFDGNGELEPHYAYGTYVAAPTGATPDFQRSFSGATQILFITGDRTVWGIADYGQMRSLIDARAADFSPNIAFEIGFNGVISQATGNVLSRYNAEDPWISIQGDHNFGVANQWIVWGEADYGSAAHQALKDSRGGMDVYIQPMAVPEPEGLALMLAGLGLLLGRSAPARLATVSQRRFVPDCGRCQ